MKPATELNDEFNKLDIDLEDEVKEFLDECVLDAMELGVPIEAILHRPLLDFDHSEDSEDCNCGIITMMVPCSNPEIEDLYEEFLKLCRKPRLLH